MEIKNIRLDSLCYIVEDVRISFDIEYSNGDKSDGYVSYDKEGKITNHCSPSLYMNKGNYTDYYLDFAKVCERLQAFEGDKAKWLIKEIEGVLSKYKGLSKDLDEKYSYKELNNLYSELQNEVSKCTASLKRLKREDKIAETTEKLNDVKSKLDEVKSKQNEYYMASDALDEQRRVELNNIVIDL